MKRSSRSTNSSVRIVLTNLANLEFQTFRRRAVTQMKVFRHKGGGAGPQAFTSTKRAGFKTVKNNDGKHLRSVF